MPVVDGCGIGMNAQAHCQVPTSKCIQVQFVINPDCVLLLPVVAGQGGSHLNHDPGP